MAEIVYGLQAQGVPLVIATDGPEMIGTRLRAEHAMLVRLGALTVEEARAANRRGHEVTLHPAGPVGPAADRGRVTPPAARRTLRA